MTDPRIQTLLTAHAVTKGMTDKERLALAVAISGTVLTPEEHSSVMVAARRIREHAEALFDAREHGHVVPDPAAEDVPLSLMAPRASSSCLERSSTDASRSVRQDWANLPGLGDVLAGLGAFGIGMAVFSVWPVLVELF